MKHIKKTSLLLILISLLTCIVLTSCQTVPKDIPNDLSEEQLIQLAQNSYDKGNTKAAEIYYETIIMRYGSNINSLIAAKYEIAHLKVKANNWKEAKPLLEEIIALYNTDSTGLPPEYKKLAELDIAKIPQEK